MYFSSRLCSIESTLPQRLECAQHGIKIRRIRRVDPAPAQVLWVLNIQGRGMKTRAREQDLIRAIWDKISRCDPSCLTIERIAGDRKAHSSQMSADLMCASGAGSRFNQTEETKPLKDSYLSQGIFPCIRINMGAVSSVSVYPKRQLNGLLVPGWIPNHQGVIGLSHPVCLELLIQQAVCSRVPRQDECPAGIPIQTMHDPQTPPTGFQEAAQVSGFRMVPIWQCRQAGGFIDRQNDFISP